MYRRKRRGEQTLAIGRSRGRSSTKFHALTDRACCSLAFLLTGGQVADCKAGALLLKRLPTFCIVSADTGYDNDAIHRQIGAMEAPLKHPDEDQSPLEAVLLARALSWLKRD